MNFDYDVIVIGAGPGGYTAALNCANFGLKVAVIEKNKIGGVCLNVGCIPTKALIHIASHSDKIKNIAGIKDVNFTLDKSEMSQHLNNVSNNIIKGIDFLLNKSNVKVFIGQACIEDKNTVLVNNEKITTKYIILAIGSSNKSVAKFMADPNDADKIMDSTTALFCNDIPKKLTVIGGGAIGTEFAYIYRCLGSEVTILEFQDKLLPNMDEECGKTLERAFKKQGINVITGAAVTQIGVSGQTKTVNYTRKDKQESIESDSVLMAMGRQPNTIDGLDNILPECNGKYIQTNDFMQTSIVNVFAIGDIRANSPQLAHVAYKQAEVVADFIAGECGIQVKSQHKLDLNLVPYGVYSEPQVAGFGYTESKAKAEFGNVISKKMLMRANGKSVAIGEIDGFVKIICDAEDKILGAWIVGNNATEILHEIMMCASIGGKSADIANLIHAHPTICEIICDVAKINL